jgi:serine phosphatase RsbU (regulator of sigma subunit)
VVIPFGDTTVTLVAEAHGQLGGTLGQQLPWILFIGGLALTAITAATAVRLVRARRRAEADGATITALYESVDRLYGEQRTIAETLQRALLPRSNPVIPGVDVASRYVAGATGVDIGGDWYSVVLLDDSRFGFVVGDVSGRGVSAAAVMARMRFTIRAYLLEGHSPDVILGKTSTQLDVEEDGHFATVLVGVGDARTGAVVLASAGHLDPLVVEGCSTYFVDVSSGPPLGIGPTRYDATTVTVPPGAVLVGFTDGLVERRGEVIDTGFARLAAAARAAATTRPDLEQFVTTVVDSLTDDGSEDDVAVLALGWHDRDSPTDDGAPARRGAGSDEGEPPSPT